MFKRIIKDKKLTSEAICQDLIDFHNRKPGITEKNYGSGKSIDGSTSYKILVDQFSDYKKKVVVDLACGNGPLVELLLKNEYQLKRIIGIDLCSSDLDEAKQRCCASNVEFVLSPADKLPVEDNSIDIILCHLSFFLFNPIESVIKEISRVLKPGGGFAAIVSGLGEVDDTFLNTVKILQNAVAEVHPHLKGFGWGDPRVNSKKGIASLFSDGFQSPDFFDFSLIISETSPEKLANRLKNYFYANYLLPEKRRLSIVKNWTALFSNIASVGDVELHFPFTAVKVVKSGA